MDGQCYQYGLGNLDMEKGPSRHCNSSFKHPLGQPLNLKLVNDKAERVARLVDPVDGYVLFDSSSRGYFDWYNKSGGRAKSNNSSIAKRGFSCLLSWEPKRRCASLLENLWRTKAEAYRAIMTATRRKENTLSQ